MASNIEKLEKIADESDDCYCPDGTDEFWSCRSCFAAGILNEISSIAYDGLVELSKDDSEYVKGRTK